MGESFSIDKTNPEIILWKDKSNHIVLKYIYYVF